MLEAILNLIFPPKCPGCGSYVEHNGYWCDACTEQFLRPHRLPLEPELASIFGGGIWCLGDYDGSLKKLIADMKFEGKQRAIKALQFFTEAGWNKLDIQTIDVVTPVPLHQQKLKQRGFNQSELLFKYLFQNSDTIFKDVLKRTRDTVPQFGLSHDARLENVKGAFSFIDGAEKFIRNKNILLVDDIFTTGATFRECGKNLHKAGAGSITGLVLASGRK